MSCFKKFYGRDAAGHIDHDCITCKYWKEKSQKYGSHCSHCFADGIATIRYCHWTPRRSNLGRFKDWLLDLVHK